MADFWTAVRRGAQYFTPNPVVGTSAAQFPFSQNPKRFKVLADPDTNEPIVVLTDAVDPITGRSGDQVAIYDSTFVTAATIDNGSVGDGSAFGSGGQIRATALPQLFDGSLFARATVPSTVANATAAGAVSTQLLAAGGAAKKYRIWGIAISAVATAAATNGVVSVNEVTGGAVLLSTRVSATSAAEEGTSMSFFGLPQPTANSAIQVTSIANVTTDATIIATAAY